MRTLPAEGFAHDFHIALTRRPRAISPKYFYDEAGSRLFERICELPEYYPTRTEMALLRAHGREMADLIGPGATLIEYGAGALRKVRLLLEHLDAPAAFVPIDISGPHLLGACRDLQREHPALTIRPLVADFSRPHELPGRAVAARRIGFFPGSSLGNFAPDEALAFLKLAAEELRGGGLLIGVDLIKAPEILHAAYNDREGVTAAFNLNLLARARRELCADLDLAGFAHSAFYNAPLARVEMHLQARRKQAIVLGDQRYELDEGETLHTENSHKFSVAGFQALARRAGFVPEQVWCDARSWFSLHWLRAP
ncbi:MAG TPA: L-histidine N(alpha)-methyltransferase [Burkholderiaceae bacterium]